MRRGLGVGVAVLAAIVGAGPVAAQTPLTLGEAVRQALARDPVIAAVAADRDAATATIDVARQSYAPRVDALYQINRATHNNVSGLLFPQPVISPISGPPAIENSPSSVWGTALGTLVSWQPFDFGARAAGVAAARRAEARGHATWSRTQLETAAMVADAYLSVLASDEALKAARAAETRAATLLTLVDALVTSEVRPGLDAATARAEHAAATMQVVLAARARDQARALLAQYIGDAARGVLAMPPAPGTGDLPDRAPAEHPVLVERQAAADEAAARLDAARRTADPIVALQGTVYGRGTGVLDDNSSGTGADGLGLESYNWAVGLTVSVPLMELAHKGARETVEQLRMQAAQARREEAARDLDRRLAVARRDEQAAHEVATQARLIVDAARTVEAQATARYRAGLSSLTEVADAERRLAQAEIDAALAGLAIWRARVAVLAVTSTSVDPFVNALP